MQAYQFSSTLLYRYILYIVLGGVKSRLVTVVDNKDMFAQMTSYQEEQSLERRMLL